MRRTVDELLQRIRGDGWQVAVHNDYRQGGIAYTFWLFTHADGRWAKSEGRSDVEALEDILYRLERSPAAPAVQTGEAAKPRWVSVCEDLLEQFSCNDAVCEEPPETCPCGGDECWHCAAAQALEPPPWDRRPAAAPPIPPADPPGSLWTTPAPTGPVPGLKVDPNVTADDVRAAIAAVAPRAAAFAAPPAEPKPAAGERVEVRAAVRRVRVGLRLSRAPRSV